MGWSWDFTSKHGDLTWFNHCQGVHHMYTGLWSCLKMVCIRPFFISLEKKHDNINRLIGEHPIFSQTHRLKSLSLKVLNTHIYSCAGSSPKLFNGSPEVMTFHDSTKICWSTHLFKLSLHTEFIERLWTLWGSNARLASLGNGMDGDGEKWPESLRVKGFDVIFGASDLLPAVPRLRGTATWCGGISVLQVTWAAGGWLTCHLI